ncbi:exodeoxyribonuclease V subunit alpha [Methylomonas sp. LW13]|uniref:exodeoxyribonuclease V subunit alpha n=1 Tax=unclassified Methylomonas TaxID=2608980 RepID=UPI00051AEC82|nr:MULTISPECIES: exodeoxyribonuclease V subunit alpha [unclassified Methylomonas]PKD40818.1 exodeoxyribonuclease V subunit alpha [Methylomonas sp. Kb3]QBC27430.1 exodeoxyribonuclease V subunit alpha [Methylomonas sp. LW13]
MIRQAAVIDSMQHWVAKGWLSHLNRAFVGFLLDLDPAASDPMLWAGALVSHQLDRGEVYLDLAKLCEQPGMTLAIPADDAWAIERDTAAAELARLKVYSLEVWQAALSQSRLVSSGEGDTPLVLAGNRLYLRRYWRYEQILQSRVAQLLQPVRDQLPASLAERLQTLFPASLESPDWQKIACILALRARFAIITGGPGTGKTTTLTKLLALLIELAQQESEKPKNLNILLAAPTGKAAARVSESIAKALDKLAIDDNIKQAIPRKASTLHRLLGSRHDSRRFLHNRHHPIVADIVIVDEASMIDLEMMASLLEALPTNTQLILLGDKDQLASVEAGSVMGDLCRGAEHAAYDAETLAWIGAYASESLKPAAAPGSAINQQTVMLRHSHRFDAHSGIGQLAKAVNQGDALQAQAILADTAQYPDLLPEPHAEYIALRQHPSPDAASSLLRKLVINSGDAARRGYGYYLAQISNGRPDSAERYDEWAMQVLTAFDAFQVLSALRKGPWGVEGLNQRIEEWLFAKAKQALWYEGRPVMITRNDYNLGLMNGDIGIALRDSNGKLKVAFPSADNSNEPSANLKIRWISPMRLPDVETAFAITVHKSQGSEFNHVALVMPENISPVLTRELIYTGITRAKEHFSLLESSDGVFAKAILTCRK